MASTVIPLRQSAVEASLKQAAFDHLPAPALCINASAQVLAANVAAGELLQAAPGELVGRHLSQIVAFTRDRDSARRWSRLWQQLQAGARTLCARVPLPNGRTLALRIDAALLRFEQESVAALVLRDETAQRAVARDAARQRARLSLLAEAADGATVLIGDDRRVNEVRGLAAVLPELSSAEVLGVPFELLLDDASSSEFLRLATGDWAGGVADSAGRPTCIWRLRQRGPAAARWVKVTVTDARRRPAARALLLHLRDITAQLETKAMAERLERRVRVFADATSDLLMLLDEQGAVRYQSAAIRESLGVTPEVTLGRQVAELFVADDRARLAEVLAAAVADHAGLRSHHALLRALHAGGSAHRLWLTLRNCSADPAIGGVLVSARDITHALRDAAAPLGDQARRLDFRERLLELAMQTRGDFAQSLSRLLRATAQTLRAGGVGFWRRSNDGTTLQCEAQFDYETDRFARDWVGVKLHLADDPDYFDRIDQRQPVIVTDTRAPISAPRFVEEPRWVGVRAVLDAPVLLDGEVQGVLTVHHPHARVWDEDEINFVSTAALMTALAIEAAQRQDAEGRIEQLAWYDSLTGLPNRNLLRETMRDLIMTAANRRRRIAVMLIDLDRFKDVNDTLGHLVGDALIKSVAQTLRETVGDAGLVARLGGDEFVVLINEFEHRQEVALLAARIAQSLHRTDFVSNVDTQVSASVGIALFPEHGRDMSTLLKNADSAMYQAKRDGRNQFSFFNPIRYERAAREVQLGIQLLKAVQADNAQFVVDYQPQVEMATGRVVGLEALIRWQHPTFGLLTPDRFIGVAELSGLSERITRWIINEVCAQIVRWRQVLPAFDIPVAVNVSGREMGSVGLPAMIRGALHKHGVEPRMLVLEITERTLVKEGEINNDVMSELAALGVGLVLDDFGTGYSMLGYLKRMPIQALKVDQSFVVGVPEDADSRAIVHAMLAVARHFRLKVVAEGIETAEQVDYLRSIGCEYAQGYYYSRPIPAQTIVEYVEHGAP